MSDETTRASRHGTYATFLAHAKARSVIGTMRYHAFTVIKEVEVNAHRLHRAMSSKFRRYLQPRIRRNVAAPAHELDEYINRGANYLARLFVEDCAVVLRNKLERYGHSDVAERYLGLRPLSIGHPMPEPFADLIETFGTYQITKGHHDRILYVCTLDLGEDRRYGIPEGDW